MSHVQLNQLTGAWTRSNIKYPDGHEDHTTRVYWLQGFKHYADIRLPAHRPMFEGVDSIAECNPSQIHYLLTQQGFAGVLHQHDQNFHWVRHIDFQPETGIRDIGKLTFTDATGHSMKEVGVDSPYEETWVRVDGQIEAHRDVLVMAAEGEKALLVVVGRHAIKVIDHRPPLIGAADLASLQAKRSAAELLDMEISYAQRLPDGHWLINASTFPWQEAGALFEHFSFADHGIDEVVEGPNPRRWRAVEGNATASDLFKVS